MASSPYTQPRTKITPPQLAARWGVSPEKIIGLILAGELHAIDAASAGCTRPRYLIDERDIAAFEQRRAVVQRPAVQRRRQTGRKYF